MRARCTRKMNAWALRQFEPCVVTSSARSERRPNGRIRMRSCVSAPFIAFSLLSHRAHLHKKCHEREHWLWSKLTTCSHNFVWTVHICSENLREIVSFLGVVTVAVLKITALLKGRTYMSDSLPIPDTLEEYMTHITFSNIQRSAVYDACYWILSGALKGLKGYSQHALYNGSF